MNRRKCNADASSRVAGAVADWAVAACESLSGLAQPAAARAVLGLALRCKAATTGVAGARGAAAGGGSQWALGDDLDLLREVAVDIKSYLDMGGQAASRHLLVCWWGREEGGLRLGRAGV